MRLQQRIVAASDVVMRQENDSDRDVDGAHEIYGCAAIRCERGGGGGSPGDVRKLLACTERLDLRETLSELLNSTEVESCRVLRYSDKAFNRSIEILERCLALSRK